MSEPPLDVLTASWLRSLRARNIATQTLATCGTAARQFTAHLAAHAPDVLGGADIRRGYVEEFIGELAATPSGCVNSNWPQADRADSSHGRNT